MRDTGVLREYGFPVFSISTTPRQGPHVHQPWSCNTVINCGGVVVRPGDAIVGDDDGCVVIPAAVAQEVFDIAHSREIVEDIVKTELTKNPAPGKYYPFMSGKIKRSPLWKLIESKGHDPKKFKHTSARPGARASAGAAGVPGFHAARRSKALPGAGSARRYSGNSYVQTAASYDDVLKRRAAQGVRGAPDPDRGARFCPRWTPRSPAVSSSRSSRSRPRVASTRCPSTRRTDVLTGVGTVMTIDDAKNAMGRGRGSSSPGFDPRGRRVVRRAPDRRRARVPDPHRDDPGVQARRAHPALHRASWRRAGRAVAALPMLRINPTSGVEVDTAADYLPSGASSLGFVAPAFPPDMVAAKDWDGISAIARKVQEAVNSV